MDPSAFGNMIWQSGVLFLGIGGCIYLLVKSMTSGYGALIAAQGMRIAALESKSVSEDALRTYKRVVYGSLFAAGLSIVLAVINAFSRMR